MVQNGVTKQQSYYPAAAGAMEVTSMEHGPTAASKCFDDDGLPKRTGTMWTASAHIITAVIGSGVLSLAWAIAQLGWVAGPTVMLFFSFVTYYTSALLADCYRSGGEITGKRNYTYMDAVNANLSGIKVQICGFLQYANIVGVAIGYTIAASISMLAIKWSNCFHKEGHGDPCYISSTSKVMRRATVVSVVVSVAVTALFYMLCGCMGYAAFGDDAPGNLLTGFGFYKPFWLLDVANAAIVVHLVGAYQVYCQPLFAFVERWALQRWPKSRYVTGEKVDVPLGSSGRCYKLNLFRFTWRSAFVVATTVVSMLLPFFNDVVGLLGALGFWPLTVYFPVEMYIVQKKVPRWSMLWVCLQLLSLGCLITGASLGL